MLPQPIGGVITDGNDGGRVFNEAPQIQSSGFVGAKEVVGVASEAVAQSVELPDPPCGAGGETSEVGVEVADTGFAEFLPDPGGFVDTRLIRAIPPFTQRQNDGLRKLPAVLHGLDFDQQGLRSRQGDDLVDQILRKMADHFFCGAADGKKE